MNQINLFLYVVYIYVNVFHDFYVYMTMTSQQICINNTVLD